MSIKTFEFHPLQNDKKIFFAENELGIVKVIRKLSGVIKHKKHKERGSCNANILHRTKCI